MQNGEIHRKAAERYLEKTGYDHNWKNPEVKEALKKECKETYGVEFHCQREDVIEKIKCTKLERYGVPCSPSYTYSYDGFSFDSSWELAYYIWLKDHDIDFTYPSSHKLKYEDMHGKQHTYCPDFIVEGQIIEIKGPHLIDENGNLTTIYSKDLSENEYEYLVDKNRRKTQCMKDNNVKILKKDDMIEYLKYVEDTYGKDYLKSFKKK